MRRFDINGLSISRLLADWKWLCPADMTLIARNVFGDLFISDASGKVFQLDVGGGELKAVADSVSQFNFLADTAKKREEWFCQQQVVDAAQRDLTPTEQQCIGFKIPLVFRESADVPDNAYIADLYEHVSFLGALHRKIAKLPDNTKVELKAKSPVIH
jgi:hypothetical protein